jgi:hypothetical protein
MSEEWSKSGLPDDRTPEQIIRERIEFLGAALGRKITEELIVVFQDGLKGYPKSVLKRAFGKAEQQLEKFPTPKGMKKLCDEEMPSQGWRYQYKGAFDKDGVHCQVDPETGEKMYRPQDCPEGREFLLELRRIAGKGKR